MSPAIRSTVRVSGWEATLLEVDALHAPRRWVDPHAAEDEVAWLPCHVLLCRRGDEVLLVDGGLGPLDGFFDMPVRRASLAVALGEVGCAPADVATVVLTHFDPDHAGGVVDGVYPDALRPSLPRARIVALRQDGMLADHAGRIVAALRSGGIQVDFVDDGSVVAPGVRLRAAPGHRAGHAALELVEGDGRLVFLADVVHARDHVAHPEWDSLHDSEPEVALATRRALIGELAGTGAVVACSHVGAFGRIEPGRSGGEPGRSGGEPGRSGGEPGSAWVDVA